VAAYAVDYESQGVFNALNFRHARGRRPQGYDINKLLELTISSSRLTPSQLFWVVHFVAPVCDGTNTSSAGKSHPIITPRGSSVGAHTGFLGTAITYRAVTLSLPAKKINPTGSPAKAAEKRNQRRLRLTL